MNTVSEKIIDLYLQILNLKREIRRGWQNAGVMNPESVADHSFGTAVLAILLEPSGMDISKLVALAVVHDLLECITGDIIWETGNKRDVLTKQRKEQAEAEALTVIQSYLPKNHLLLRLLQEYNEQVTPEAKYVKLLDKLEMSMQALDYSKQVDVQEFMNSVEKYLKESQVSSLFSAINDRIIINY